MTIRHRALSAGLSLALIAVPAGLALAHDDDDDGGGKFGKRIKPASSIVYDGVSDDLLTAGLGKSGLAGAAPGFSDPLNPTAAELRRLAIYNNYRALVDISTSGGYGVLYGPNLDAAGNDSGTEGLIAGTEVIGFADRYRGKQNVTMMVQVPDSFDPDEACIVTAPSSGSRGVYGAIATAGEWGLKNGCAVAYTDKGTGTGAHNLQDDTVGLIDGTRADADDAGRRSTFTARLSNARLAAFNAATPNRWAFKHAHSRLNPEADWGRDVLRSIQFAFQVLNDLHGGDGDDDDDDRHYGGHHGGKRPAIHPGNTIVIASSVSNGGGASVRAAELDRKGLIDGVAVSEPNVNPRFDDRFTIVQGAQPPFAAHSRSLYDYTSIQNVFQACANVGSAAPFNFLPSPLRCQALRDKSLLSADDLAGQAAEAQAILNDFGFLVEQNIVEPSHWSISVPQAIAMTYANAYGRAKVTDNLCGYSFAGVDALAAPAPLAPAAEAALFATSNGIPPTGGLQLINNKSVGGPINNNLSVSPSSGLADQNLDGALCLRGLATGRDAVTGAKLRGKAKKVAKRVAKSIRRILAKGDLRGKPAIFVTGRNDAILPPNHTSRAYFGLNRLVEGGNSGLRYIEVKNAQHLDALNNVGVIPQFAELFVPLHHYYIQGLDLLLDHLRNGTPLPPSQVVRTVPRGPGAPQIGLANLPDIQASPPAADRIVFADNEVRIPE